MSDEPEDLPELPAGYSYMSINADEMEYLKSYWEMRDNGQLFGWALRLLYDLSKVDEKGWVIAFHKGEVDESTFKVKTDPDYSAVPFKLKWMTPDGDKYYRIPINDLDKIARKKEGEE